MSTVTLGRAAATPVRTLTARLGRAPHRDVLSPASIAARLARRTDLWGPAVRVDRRERVFVRLAQGVSWEAWLLTWARGQSTGIHDHGGSAGAFVVLRGLLTERVWNPADLSGRPIERHLIAGRVRSFGSALVHDVGNVRDEAAVSLHVYSPRLSEMTRYRDDLSVDRVERSEVDW